MQLATNLKSFLQQSVVVFTTKYFFLEEKDTEYPYLIRKE